MIELTERQGKILDIVRKHQPITGERIAEILDVTRAALRPDLAVLTMSGYLEAKPRVGYTIKSEGAQGAIRKILCQYRVKDVKSMPVVVKDTSSIYDAIVTLFTEDAGTIYVTDRDGYLAGVVSRKDFLKTTLGHIDIYKVPVSVIMTRMPNIIVTTPDETVIEAVKKIVEHEIDSLPVVKKYIDENGDEKLEVVGRITKTNIARLLLDLANQKKEG
ncbi:MAG TPA: helix-turn-helix transcriptional regulator [Syntrophothermus lipocalidus]|uniref:Signal transduction protein with CBS domains n=1 Tax=Syntrophothermus lipocalidus (strain DSM 12680 / TGB-C1) TaxID=643648 RepID=D7CNV1_SYNLT|nr:putative signal transduction protein with CBS domains [Syntrophothermus lipocalidus DSM 12680]HHV77792.1 helix-turn-helix transcriptional regulator [Syntrophothermus lipocalidus]